MNLNDTALSYASRETGMFAPELTIETTTYSLPLAPPTATVVLATGDIAGCTSDGDEAVAALLDDFSGPILTLGDTVYQSGHNGGIRRVL